MGKVMKGLVSFTVAAATVGGVCYAFRDKIKASKPYKDYKVDEKLKKVASAIKEKLPGQDVNEEDIVDADEVFFEDAIIAERDYVSIDPESSDNETGDADEADKADSDEADSQDDAADDKDDVPTIDL